MYSNKCWLHSYWRYICPNSFPNVLLVLHIVVWLPPSKLYVKTTTLALCVWRSKYGWHSISECVCVYRFGSCCPISVTQFDCFCHQSESLSYSPQLGLLRTALRAFISISADLWRQKPFPPSIQEANITLTILFFPLTNSFNFLRVCFATIDHFENHMWFRTKRPGSDFYHLYQ